MKNNCTIRYFKMEITVKNTRTIVRNNEFRRLYGRAKTMVHPLFVTYYIKNRYKNNRIGITATKKIGNAVARNRARRILKESYRLLEQDFPSGYDFIFVARKKTTLSKTTETLKAMRNVIKELNKENYDKKSTFKSN